MQVIHYHEATGQIAAWGNADCETSHFKDHKIARLDALPEGFGPQTHRIEIEEVRIVEKTTAEIAIENMPQLFEIEAIVRGALAASDEFMMPDRTVPNREAWATYRQALRDLSNQLDAAAMIDAWPARPDGVDPIEGLRTRLADARAAQDEA